MGVCEGIRTQCSRRRWQLGESQLAYVHLGDRDARVAARNGGREGGARVDGVDNRAAPVFARPTLPAAPWSCLTNPLTRFLWAPTTCLFAAVMTAGSVVSTAEESMFDSEVMGLTKHLCEDFGRVVSDVGFCDRFGMDAKKLKRNQRRLSAICALIDRVLWHRLEAHVAT